MKTSLLILLFALISLNTVAQQDEPIYIIVEQMCEFPSGDKGLKTFIKNTMNYPKDAIEKGIEGKVYVRFVVTSTGKIKDPTVLRGVHPSLDAEALRIVENFPDFIPGKQFSKPASVYHMEIIQFSITEYKTWDKSIAKIPIISISSPNDSIISVNNPNFEINATIETTVQLDSYQIRYYLNGEYQSYDSNYRIPTDKRTIDIVKNIILSPGENFIKIYAGNKFGYSVKGFTINYSETD